MSAAKFTPGPWELRNEFGMQGLVYPVGSDYPVASVTGYFSRAGQTPANAALIAAAPELYEALETLAEALTTGAGRDFIEAFLRDAKAALEQAAPGWNMLAEPSRQKLRELANVRAAAPQLLEAARAFVAPFDGIEMVEGSAVALARAAIAKAEGSAS